MRHYNRCVDCQQSIGAYGRKRCKLCDKKFKTSFKGEKSSTWKGGWQINTGGYREIHKSIVEKQYHYLADCRNYIKEHRLIAAKKYNRILNKKDIVHHLNGIRTDNRPENLIIVDSSNHEPHTFEKKLQERVKELELELGMIKN